MPTPNTKRPQRTARPSAAQVGQHHQCLSPAHLPQLADSRTLPLHAHAWPKDSDAHCQLAAPCLLPAVPVDVAHDPPLPGPRQRVHAPAGPPGLTPIAPAARISPPASRKSSPTSLPSTWLPAGCLRAPDTRFPSCAARGRVSQDLPVAAAVCRPLPAVHLPLHGARFPPFAVRRPLPAARFPLLTVCPLPTASAPRSLPTFSRLLLLPPPRSQPAFSRWLPASRRPPLHFCLTFIINHVGASANSQTLCLHFIMPHHPGLTPGAFRAPSSRHSVQCMPHAQSC
ncbi:hypothetical protein GGX14DRAFT_580633 [Mycena pura]|uniref:Uncharacterized protein n=1 Tax=Mycena pura TaxID=153505 RepID=A0AAD6UNM7_9AGAR|nr:hypothetical protein GGX14DRAFT_580633 [Mycena pura]